MSDRNDSMAFIDLFGFSHFLFIFIGLLLMGIGVLFTYLKKQLKPWFLLHKIFTAVGLLSCSIGIISLVSIYLTILHSILGLVSLLFCLGALIGGVGFLYVKKNKKKLRTGHIWIARIGIFLMVIALILGIMPFL